MNPLVIGSLVFGSIFGAALLAMLSKRVMPQHHLVPATKDTVQLAMGLVATMAALVLGLLVASAKGSYDAEKSEVTSMAAKVAFLDRLLAMYGPDSMEARHVLRDAVERMIARTWPKSDSQPPQLAPAASPEALYSAFQRLSPKTDAQRDFKAQILASAYDIGETRWLLAAQAGSSISMPLLVVLVCWLAILFFSFGLFAPPNGTAIVALMVAAMSVAGAVFLILELDQPFGGVIQISSEPMIKTLARLGN